MGTRQRHSVQWVLQISAMSHSNRLAGQAHQIHCQETTDDTSKKILVRQDDRRRHSVDDARPRTLLYGFLQNDPYVSNGTHFSSSVAG